MTTTDDSGHGPPAPSDPTDGERPQLTIERMIELLAKGLADSGMTQAELARRSGMTEKHVSRVLTGRNTASTATLDYWAFLLGLRFIVGLQPRESGRG
jgi:transcriptional regulator with XRE-family HTH domain